MEKKSTEKKSTEKKSTEQELTNQKNIYNIDINIYHLDQSNNRYDTDNNIIQIETFNNENINSNDIKFDNLNLYEYMTKELTVNDQNPFHLKYYYNKDNNTINNVYINKDIIAKCKKNFYKDFDKIIDRKQSEQLFENFNDIIKQYKSSLGSSIKTKSGESGNNPFAEVQAQAAAPVQAEVQAQASAPAQAEVQAPPAAQAETPAAAQASAPTASAAPPAAQAEVQAVAPAQAEVQAPDAAPDNPQDGTHTIDTSSKKESLIKNFEFIFNYVNQLLNTFSATQLNSVNKLIHTYLYLYKMLDYIDNNKYQFCNVSNNDKRDKSIEILNCFKKFFINFEEILGENLKYFENSLSEFKYICDVQNYYDHILTYSTELNNYIYMFNNINVLIASKHHHEL